MYFDTLITDGMVIDGTGRLRFSADVGISGGRISAIGSFPDADAALVIKASGLIVSPGFIDMHSHSDVTLLDDPGGDSKAHQGVSTEVTGNCGVSSFPITSVARSDEGDPDMTSVHPWVWTDLDGWANTLEEKGISINLAPQLGHSAIRNLVGLSDDRRPTADELTSMQRLVTESLEQGAFGMSTGLTVAPSMYGDTYEIAALASSMAPFEGAYYATHARLWAGRHVRAVEEAVDIGRRARVPVQYSHMAIIDPRYYGTSDQMIEPIERARDDGFDVTYDVYPYTAAGSHLAQMVPSWVQDGGEQAMLRRIRDRGTRERAIEDMRLGFFGGLPWDFDTYVISYVKTEQNQDLVGTTIQQIAVDRNQDPHETYLSLIDEEDNHVGAVIHNRAEVDVMSFLASPYAMIGSDGNAISPIGVHRDEKPHPRFYGTYPRILGRYVRGQSVMSLETAVMKMTGMPAERLRLVDRGRIAEQMVADLVVFDPETIIDRSTFDTPHQLSEGVEHLLVDGVPVISDGLHTNARPGRVLRRDS